MAHEPDNSVPPGKIECRVCGEIGPVHYMPCGICWGCYAAVEIDRRMGLRKYQELEQYEYDPRFGQRNAIKKPRTGLAHLDAHHRRVTNAGEVAYLEGNSKRAKEHREQRWLG